jgi:hypothetical protein
MSTTTTTTTSAELEALISSLDAQRAHVLGILEGLTDEQLRRPVLPSGWSCLGLLGHLTFDVERFWFRATVAGEQEAIAASLTSESSWQVPDGLTAGDAFADYRRQIELANSVLRNRGLPDAPAWWAPFFGDYRLHTVREVVLHVLTETACHAGHLDAVRELIDGRQWLDLEG